MAFWETHSSAKINRRLTYAVGWPAISPLMASTPEASGQIMRKETMGIKGERITVSFILRIGPTWSRPYAFAVRFGAYN